MAEPQDTIRRVNDDQPMTEDELQLAKAVLDRFASRGKVDVLAARNQVHKMMRAQGIELPAEPAKAVPASGSKAGAWVVIVGAVVLVGGCIALVSGGDDDDDDSSSGGDEVGASIVCEQFMEDRLRSPGTAEFASYSTQTITGGPTEYVVRSYVDSENGFGALLRTDYTCTTRWTDGDNWTLVDLDTSG